MGRVLGREKRGRSMLRPYKTKALGGPHMRPKQILTKVLGRPHMRPKQIFTCSSILESLSAERTPMGGYLSKVFSRVVT